MPLLARMLTCPLFVDVRAGAVAGLGALLSDRRISTDGRVAVAVGPGQGADIAATLQPTLGNAEVITVAGGSLADAGALQEQVKKGSYDALVGIGGGRTLDVTKYAATRLALPMIAVATNLSHDGICSPVSSLDHDGGKGSFGVAMPLAVVVDLDRVREAPPQMVRSGVGDVVSNLSAIADVELAARERGESVDGLAVTFARTAADAVLYRPDGIDSDGFLTALAEALVLSGMAMSAAGSSRPCSGGDHEILHAVDALFPGTSNHGELAGIGALFCFFLRGDEQRVAEIDTCLRRHDLPRLPADIGLSDDDFARAVCHAPQTRPDRFTILEHLDLDAGTTLDRVKAFAAALG